MQAIEQELASLRASSAAANPLLAVLGPLGASSAEQAGEATGRVAAAADSSDIFTPDDDGASEGGRGLLVELVENRLTDAPPNFHQAIFRDGM